MTVSSAYRITIIGNPLIWTVGKWYVYVDQYGKQDIALMNTLFYFTILSCSCILFSGYSFLIPVLIIYKYLISFTSRTISLGYDLRRLCSLFFRISICCSRRYRHFYSDSCYYYFGGWVRNILIAICLGRTQN